MDEVMENKEKKNCIAPAIKAFEHYDYSKAKLCSSIKWLVAKAYGPGRCCFFFYFSKCMVR